MALHFDVGSTAPALRPSVARPFAHQLEHALEADHAFTLGYLRAGARPRRGRA
jgi:hypothetical protein